MPPKKKSITSRSKGKSTNKRPSKETTSLVTLSETDDGEVEEAEQKKVSKPKSVGKFHCLAESTNNADSGLDTEYKHTDQQSMNDGDLYDSVLISSDADVVDAVQMEYEDGEGESIEIIATEISHQLSDLHMFNEGDYLEHPISDQKVEISNSYSISGLQFLASVDKSAVVSSESAVINNSKETGSKNGKSGLKKGTTKKLSKLKKNKNKKNLESENSAGFENIRRSVRIKCKETSKIEEHPKSKTKKTPKSSLDSDAGGSNSSSGEPERSSDAPTLALPLSGYDSDKPVKVKSRWRRSSEIEMENNSKNNDSDDEVELEDPLTTFIDLKENLYLTPKVICKEAKKMACDCVLTVEEIGRGELGCGDDCLNRLLMIECGLCPVNERCSNKKFQKCEYAPCEVFRTNKKGSGIRATADIPFGQFILEYVGEVIGPDEFEERATDYSRDKNPHHYFMALRSDAVIDATAKGNISRFINHSCDPNAETQKWTVNGELRIGFFSKRTILSGEEITFDYQFQRYGKDAQKCLCEATTCRGWLGAEPDEEVDEEEEDEEEEDGEEAEEEANQAHEDLVEQKVEADIKQETSATIETVVEDKSSALLDCVQIDETNITISTKKEDVTIPATLIEQSPVLTQTCLSGDAKKSIKKEKRKIIKRKVRKEIIFENVDVDNEIEMLVQSGLKNQAHTLKLSRLMVRATEVSQRSSLLRILRRGELPCRRLFLDYHGLRLMYGWMNDAQQLCKTDKKRESLRLELLQTLATLPIPNKTMLQDSKVLQTVEKWSTKLEENITGIDSESNSPKLEMESNSEAEPCEEVKVDKEDSDKVLHPILVSSEFQIEIRSTKDIRRSVGMDRDCRRIKTIATRKRGKALLQDIIDMFDDDLDEEAKKQKATQDVDYEVEIIALALKLLEEWAILKEVFRIPKKERIEQMKEHEREADRVHKSTPDCSSEKRSERSGLYSRYRVLKRTKPTKPDFPERERNRKHTKLEESNPLKRINKHERRKLFAMQVEQRDMWRQHEMQCMSLGADPRYTPSDYTRNMQCTWNTQTGQWQPVTGNATTPNASQNRFFNYNTPNFNMPPPPLPNLPPQNLPPQNMGPYSPSPNLNISQLALTNIPRSNQLPPIQPQTNLTNITNALANLISLSGIQQLTNISGLSNATNLTQPLSNLPQTPVQIPGRVQNIPPVISLPNFQPASQESTVEENVSKVVFSGPIPPPVRLPPKWKCAKDKYGRPYYYHIKIRMSQWEPPEFPPPPPVEYEEESDESFSSSNSSGSSEDSTTEGSDDEDDDGLAGNKLLLQIRKKFQNISTSPPPQGRKIKVKAKVSLDEEIASACLEMSKTSSIDERLQNEFNLSTDTNDSVKHKRRGLVTDVFIISPRTEEDKVIAKENLKKYKQNKQRLKRHREAGLEQSKSQINVTLKRYRVENKAKFRELMDASNDEAKKIKDSFQSSMATRMVTLLNRYRKRDCTQGRITNNDDFKHLVKKLAFFVMVKQLRNCNVIEDLVCNDSVKIRAGVFVQKYMSKFGDVYIKPIGDIEY